MTAWTETRNQLGLIEVSLKALKDCQHVGNLEFRDMYSAMGHHHRNYKLAHLTGLAKDVQEKGRQDTKFYVILAKMLTEITSVNGENPDGIHKVYAWYESNRHSLHTKPKFGMNKKEFKRRAISAAKSTKNEANSQQQLSEPKSPPHTNDGDVEFLHKDKDLLSSAQDVPVEQESVNHQTVNIQMIEESLLPKRKTFPLTHIFNPLSRALEEMEKQDNTQEPVMSVHVSPRATTRSTHAKKLPQAKWEDYLRENKAEQEIISKLQHVGRSGTPGTVRYAAHENGIPAEDLTQDIINAYVQYNRPPSTELDDTLLRQPLEEFYQSTDGHYPFHRGRKNSKMKSATSGRSSALSRESAGSRATDRSQSRPLSQAGTRESTPMKLDTVVNMIDSVTDEMTYHKEMLIVEPSSGFRQPTTTVDPDLNLDAAPPGSLARPSTPSDHGKFDVQGVDWRGRITPEPSKNKWRKSGFGTHSFVKKITRPKTSQGSLRSAGSVILNKRPTTAPVPAKQRWGTHNPSDLNKRAPCQAATHSTMEVDDKATNEMINIRHLDSTGAGRRTRSGFFGDLDISFLGSDFSLEQELMMLRSDLHPFTCPTSSNLVEFVNITAPKALQDTRALSAGHRPQALTAPPQTADYFPLACDADKEQFKPQADHPGESMTFLTDEEGIRQSTQDNTKESDIGVTQAAQEIEESEQILPELNNFMRDQQVAASDTDQSTPPPPSAKISQHTNVTGQIEINEQLNSNTGLEIESSSLPPELRQIVPRSDEHITVLPDIQSVPQDIDIDQYLKEREKKNTPVLNQHVKLASSYRQRIFQRTLSKHKNLEDNQKETQSLTIEGHSNRSFHKMRTAGTAPPRARSASQKRVLQKQQDMLKRTPVTVSRTSPSIPTPYHVQVPIAKQTSRGKTFSPELDSHARKDRNPKHYMDKVGGLRIGNMTTPAPPTGTDNYLQGSLTVSRFVDNRKEKRTAQTEIGDISGSESGSLKSDASADSRTVRIHITHKPPRGTTDMNKIGRPIPEYGLVQTPEEYQETIRIQRLAKAAVDIQRIFRGYVARNQYNYLRREVREEREDERKAEIEKQRQHIEHLERLNEIYSRHPDQEAQKWTEQYEQQLSELKLDRSAKAEEKREEHRMNKSAADENLSVIGPHLEVYVPFHPKRVGPSKTTLQKAACIMQKIVRGWLVRQRMDRLKRKSKWHASSWSKFTSQYQDLLRRIQLRAGIQRPKAPFSYAEINEFMDLKKRYESVFEKRAFGGELEVQELVEYFHECDLYPTTMELDGAFDSVFRGKEVRKGRGLHKHEVLELTFQLYPPRGTGIVREQRSSWMKPIIDGEEALKLLGTEGVESTDFQTCWNLVATSRRQRKENEKALLLEERNRKIEDEIIWQKTADARNEECHSIDNEEVEVGVRKIKGKVRFNDNVKEHREATDNIPDESEFEIPREVSLGGILSAIENEEQRD